ncbi:MAG: DEAD/DEAH box helicase [Ferruginibacter sp.]|nr:DEAD/DEAH box helicase [Cytophagales bacterium]
MGYVACTPIQAQAIPLILQGKDLIGCAQTGTGKTAAFLLPLFQQLLHTEGNYVKVLVVVPTRELAKQIDGMVDGLAYHSPIRSIAVYGGGKGEDWSQQQRAFEEGADMVVGTPGRLIAHLQTGKLKLDKIRHLVLDEADKMLEMGFYDDIMSIVAQLPTQRQTLLFSATMPARIRTLAKKILVDPAEINIATAKPAAGIQQSAYILHDSQKLPLLRHLFRQKEVESMLLFTGRKSNVNEIVRSLAKIGFTVEGIHSDRTQEEREKVLNDFKNRQFKILVATDILSRGIDVENISHVVNYEVPDPEDYVHRIGRTARASTTGEAITFVNPTDQGRLARIEKLIEREVPKPPLPEELGKAPEYNPAARVVPRGSSGGNRPKGNFQRKKSPQRNPSKPQ